MTDNQYSLLVLGASFIAPILASAVINRSIGVHDSWQDATALFNPFGCASYSFRQILDANVKDSLFYLGCTALFSLGTYLTYSACMTRNKYLAAGAALLTALQIGISAAASRE